MMSTVKKLSEEIAAGLIDLVPDLNKPVVRKLSLAVAAMLEAQTPNTVELSNLLPLDTERQDMREQWLRRLLTSPALCCKKVIAPFASDSLQQATKNGQTILLSMDQTDLGDRMAILMLTVRIGGRALPLIWRGLRRSGTENRVSVYHNSHLMWPQSGVSQEFPNP